MLREHDNKKSSCNCIHSNVEHSVGVLCVYCIGKNKEQTNQTMFWQNIH